MEIKNGEMSAQAQQVLTEADYLTIEREAETKSEYLNGQMFAMAGASPRHVLITTNVIAELHAFLKAGDCRVFSSDQRLRVEATGLNAYPDVMVVCGELRFSDELRDTVVNPILLVEVLSKSTSDFDRGEKFMNYRALETLEDYLLIDQYRPHVEYYSRQPDGRWILEELDDPAGSLYLASIGFELKMVDVYYGFDLD